MSNTELTMTPASILLCGVTRWHLNILNSATGILYSKWILRSWFSLSPSGQEISPSIRMPLNAFCLGCLHSITTFMQDGLQFIGMIWPPLIKLTAASKRNLIVENLWCPKLEIPSHLWELIRATNN